MRSMLTVTALTVILAFSAGAARAQGWCLDYDAYTHTCGFTSFAQCQASASGAGGLCRPDVNRAPEVRPQPRYRVRKPIRKRHRHHD